MLRLCRRDHGTLWAKVTGGLFSEEEGRKRGLFSGSACVIEAGQEQATPDQAVPPRPLASYSENSK